MVDYFWLERMVGVFVLIMGGEFTLVDYLFWNEIPTVLGNLAGGLFLVGLPLYFTHVRTNPERKIS